jgi:hypothetical protein
VASDQTPPESYEVLVRVTVRRSDDGRRVGPDAIGAFDCEGFVRPTDLGEAALEAAKLRASGVGSAAAAVARARVAVRNLVRNPDVRRGVAIVATALRKGATTLEEESARAAAKIVLQRTEPNGVDQE